MDVRVGHEESWASKKMLLNCGVKTLESPLECKEIKPVSPKGNQPWILIGRIAAEVLILWPPDAKNWLFSWKDPDAGNDWKQEEKGMTEEEMVERHHYLNGVNLNKLQELVMNREAWCATFHGVTKTWTQLNNWTYRKFMRKTNIAKTTEVWTSKSHKR